MRGHPAPLAPRRHAAPPLSDRRRPPLAAGRRPEEGTMTDSAGPRAASGIRGRVIGVSSAAALGGFLFGFDTAVINGAVDALAGAFDLGVGLKGFAVSSALI